MSTTVRRYISGCQIVHSTYSMAGAYHRVEWYHLGRRLCAHTGTVVNADIGIIMSACIGTVVSAGIGTLVSVCTFTLVSASTGTIVVLILALS